MSGETGPPVARPPVGNSRSGDGRGSPDPRPYQEPVDRAHRISLLLTAAIRAWHEGVTAQVGSFDIGPAPANWSPSKDPIPTEPHPLMGNWRLRDCIDPTCTRCPR